MGKFEEVLAGLQKKYGKKVVRGSDIPRQGRLPTGSLALDVGLGGGWPQGKITVINGRNSVAKTATAYHAIAEAQRLLPGRAAGWVSMEPFDRAWAEINGVDLSRLYVAEPETGEEAVNVYEAFLDSHEMSILVLDSLGALAPTYELENEAENGMMGTRAKLIKKLMMKTNARLQPTKEGKYNDCACLFLNHIYDSMDKYVPYTVAGGRSVWMFSSLMVTFIKREFKWEGVEKESDVIGLKIEVKTEKDKVRGLAQPFHFSLFNRDGWDGAAKAGHYDDFEAMIALGQLYPSPEEPIIKRGGAWFTLPDGEKVQGETKVWNYLNEHQGYAYEVVEKAIREKTLGEVFTSGLEK